VLTITISILERLMNDPPKRILLIEDHRDTRVATAKSLRHHGYTVQTAATIAEGMRMLDAEPFDLLLSDIGLPDGSGLDLMRTIAARSSIRAIAYTAYSFDTDIAEYIAAGFLAHIGKPTNLQHLLATVARILNGSVATSLPLVNLIAPLIIPADRPQLPRTPRVTGFPPQ
jgi:CheY-like chemotaxis protein